MKPMGCEIIILKKNERSEVVLFRFEIGRGLGRRLGFGLG